MDRGNYLAAHHTYIQGGKNYMTLLWDWGSHTEFCWWGNYETTKAQYFLLRSALTLQGEYHNLPYQRPFSGQQKWICLSCPHFEPLIYSLWSVKVDEQRCGWLWSHTGADRICCELQQRMWVEKRRWTQGDVTVNLKEILACSYWTRADQSLCKLEQSLLLWIYLESGQFLKRGW